MPHQCLGCGFAFEEGSSALLAGCPKCKGTKFFYSAKPVSDDERREMQEAAQDDLRAVVQNVLQETNPTIARELESEEGWAELTPRQLRRIVKQVQADQKTEAKPERKAPTTAVVPSAFDDKPVDSPQRLKEARKLRDDIIAEFSAGDEEKHPDTVNVGGDGQYDVDVKALLEKDPIVVHKDGAYMIHLPSLFDGNKKK